MKQLLYSFVAEILRLRFVPSEKDRISPQTYLNIHLHNITEESYNTQAFSVLSPNLKGKSESQDNRLNFFKLNVSSRSTAAILDKPFQYC